MKRNYLYLILFVFIISTSLYYCNEEDKNNNINKENEESKNNTEKKKNSIDKKNEESKNNTEKKKNSIDKKNEVNEDKEKVKNSNTVQEFKYYDKEKLEKWSENFLKYLKSFSDREIKEKELVKEGRGLIHVYDKYLDLYVELEEIQKSYNKNVEKPPKELPKVAYATLKICKDKFNIAMSKKIESIENMVLFIDSLRKKENHKDEKTIDSSTNEALNKYQQYSIDYDEIIKKIIIALKDIYMKFGYEVDFNEGQIIKLN